MKNTLAYLTELLRRRNEQPEEAPRIDLELNKTFYAQRAIYVSDMSGFSRIVKTHGIIHFLAMIQQMRDLAIPAIEQNHGAIVKTEADNVFAVFECVEDAVRTSQQVLSACGRVNAGLPLDRQTHLSIGIGWGKILLIDYHDMYGDEMNLASKLGEDVAERDEVLLTDAAHGALAQGYVRGEQRALDISGVALKYWAISR